MVGGLHPSRRAAHAALLRMRSRPHGEEQRRASRTIGPYGIADASIELDAGLADQSCPVRVFGDDEGIELVVRQIPYLAAALLKTLLELRQRGADSAAQPGDRFRRGFRGRENAEP